MPEAGGKGKGSGIRKTRGGKGSVFVRGRKGWVSPLRQVVLAHWREDLDGDAVGEGDCMVGSVAGDAPAVTGLGEAGSVVDGQFQVAGDEIAGLLVGVGVAGKEGALLETKFGKKGVGAENEGLLADFVEDGLVTGSAGFLEHMDSLNIDFRE
jgi:hypothetical protein